MSLNVVLFIALVSAVFCGIFTLVDIWRNEASKTNDTLWLLATVFVPFLGVLLYLLFGRKSAQPRSWIASANIAGLLTVPVVTLTVAIYRFLVSQDLP